MLLTGPSGSGKTTLLTLIGALRAMQTGSAVVLGQELAGASEGERVALRRRIGFIFQQHNLLGFLSARQNVAMALELDPATREAERLERAGGMLEAVGVGDRADAMPAKLSGGQRQRVAVARALAGEPGLILADEPTAALDKRSGGEVARLLRDLAKRRGVPILMVTHDPRILDIADRIVAIEDGRVAADGRERDGGGVSGYGHGRDPEADQPPSCRRPVALAVQHGEDLDFLTADPVGNHEWRARHHQLARARHSARTPTVRELAQCLDSLAYAPGHRRGRCGRSRAM